MYETRLSAYFGFCVVLLMICPSVCIAGNKQKIYEHSCKTGSFEIFGTPYNKNEAGSHSIKVEYFFQGKELFSINLEEYYFSLNPFLKGIGKKNTTTFGLNLPTDGKSQYGGRYETGASLFMSPSDFSEHEYKDLSQCIKQNNAAIGTAFNTKTIESSALLGLMRTRARYGADGIARLYYYPKPFQAIFTHDWSFAVVEHSGEVKLCTKLPSTSENECVLVGKQIPGTDNIKLKSSVIFRKKPLDPYRHCRNLGRYRKFQEVYKLMKGS